MKKIKMVLKQRSVGATTLVGRRGLPLGSSFAVGQLVTVSTTDGDVNGIVGPGNIWYPLGP